MPKVMFALKLAVVILCGALIFAVDSQVPLGIQTSIFYIALLLPVLRLCNRDGVLFFGLCVTILTGLVFFLSPPGGILWIAAANRSLVVGALWIVILIGLLQKRAERRVRESEERKAAIMQTSLDCIITIDHESHILDFNPAAEKTFGHKKAAVLGKHLPEVIIPPAYRQAHYAGMKHYLNTGEAPVMGKRLELTALRADGTEFPVELAITQVPGHEPPIFTGFLRDITDRKQAEANLLNEKHNLEKTNLELDSFVYIASHDLRQPLRAISSFASFLEEDYAKSLDERGREFLAEIRKGADRLSELIEDLLALSRVSRIHNPYENVDIQALLKDVLERLGHDISKNKTAIVVSPGIPTVFCDRIKMTELFVNLIGNAVKFSAGADRPRVEIGHADKGSEHEFSVRDNGIGIEPDYQGQIFQLFKRLRPKEFEGTGAGLNIVKRIVEDQGGKIWVVSKAGQGADFRFTVPKAPKRSS